DGTQLAELARNIRMLERRLTELGDVPKALGRADAAARGVHERVEAVERTAEQERTVWVRDRQYAETKRTELLTQYEEVKEQRDQIVKLGPEGTCPTCKRPLGPEYAGVLALLDAQLEVITADGKYFRQRLEQLAQPPAKLLAAEVERDRVLEESRRASARAGELRAQVEERDRASAELAGARRPAGEGSLRSGGGCPARGRARGRRGPRRAEPRRRRPGRGEATGSRAGSARAPDRRAQGAPAPSQRAGPRVLGPAGRVERAHAPRDRRARLRLPRRPDRRPLRRARADGRLHAHDPRGRGPEAGHLGRRGGHCESRAAACDLADDRRAGGPAAVVARAG